YFASARFWHVDPLRSEYFGTTEAVDAISEHGAHICLRKNFVQNRAHHRRKAAHHQFPVSNCTRKQRSLSGYVSRSQSGMRAAVSFIRWPPRLSVVLSGDQHESIGLR